jgi:hypothetical protein
MKLQQKYYLFTLLLAIMASGVFAQAQKSYRISSPDQQTVFEIGNSPGKGLQYRLSVESREVITWSDLGLTVNGAETGKVTVIKQQQVRTNRSSFAWPLGENDTISNNYNELIVSCLNGTLSFNVMVRLYNGSAAFRYELVLPSGTNALIKKEQTSFHFAKPATIYQYNQESVFTPLALDHFTNTCDFPATLNSGDHFVSIGEADNRQYTKAELKTATQPNSLAVVFPRDTAVKAVGHYYTPWRTISISKTAIGLHAFSELYLKLVPQPAKEMAAGVKPGKLIRAQLNTQSGLDCIDFAFNHHFQYILFDAGWYGAEFRTSSDPTQAIPQIDMAKVIQYGKGKGIGVILYVNYVGLKQKLDTILPLYKKWGVSGLKFGFVDGLTQNGISFLASAIKKVNEYGFILDIHDNYKPTGLSRNYPVLLTQEGIRGDENSPDAFHTTVLPYTRFLAGPADFTFCFPNAKNSFSKNIKVSKAQQLALTVIYFSPLQSIFWYGQPNDYTNEAEIEFFKYVPTVWNQSRYLAGNIGQNISVARRSGTTWFVGNAAGMNDWRSSISLDFLKKGVKYTATIYEDDGTGSIRKRTLPVVKDAVFAIDIPAKGGQAIIITPVQENTGQKINFNRDWKFRLGDSQGAEAVTYNDKDWDHIGLPHSFSMPYFLSPDFYTGYGWYRKHFEVPEAYKGKKLFLEFEGAFQDAEIFVNGKKTGGHKGGYTGFCIDITDAAKPGDNVVAVRLNNLWNPGLAPRAGEHVFAGGIYRDVYLAVKDPLHIAWYGTFITTPKVTATGAVVTIQTEIKNDDTKPKRVQLKTEIFTPQGNLATTLLQSATIAPGSVLVMKQTTAELPTPQLWHPDHPFLYRAVSSLVNAQQTGDVQETTFGIRSIRWTADSGFFINGEHCYFKGANVHQDHAGWGDAVTNTGFYRDVKMIKDAGFNFIRGSHYPHDPSFADACDRQGVLFWSENAFWGIGGFANTPEGYWNASAYPTVEADRPAFDASVKQQLSEMIRVFRNHPSIIAWSMSNEPFFTSPKAIAPMRELLKQVVELTHQLDPTRPAAIGGAQRPLDSSRIDLLGDVAGYNGDGSSISVFQKPGVPSVISEYGSTTANRPGKYEPGWGDLAEDSGKAVKEWRSGQAIWCAFDHGTIAGQKLGKMGIIDYFRVPKQAWYWYRNAYNHIPPPVSVMPGVAATLKLETDRQVITATDGTEDVQLTVSILDSNGNRISNSPPVELTIRSGPGEFPTGPSIRFEQDSDISIRDGMAAIEFRSYYAGETVIRASSPGLAPSEIKIRCNGPVAYVPGKTPDTKARAYVRFSNKVKSQALQLFGRDNPTFASSADPAHPAGFAADGKENTWWQPVTGDANPSWVLQTEKRVAITRIKINFPAESIYRYTIEVSDDGQTWKPVADFRNNQLKESSRQIEVNAGTIGSTLRISFEDMASARLAEVEVTGRVIN